MVAGLSLAQLSRGFWGVLGGGWSQLGGHLGVSGAAGIPSGDPEVGSGGICLANGLSPSQAPGGREDAREEPPAALPAAS